MYVSSMRRLAVVLLMIKLALQVADVKAADLYVSKSGSDGSDNSCTDQTKPCLTIKYAVSKSNDDDRVLIKGSDSFDFDDVSTDKSIELDKWEVQPHLLCSKSQSCTSVFNGAAVTFGDLLVDSCWVCLNDIRFSSTRTEFVDSKLLIDVQKSSEADFKEASLTDTAMSITNPCAQTFNQSCLATSLNLQMKNTVMRGKDSVLKCSGNITEMTVYIEETTFDNIGSGFAITNFYTLKFTATNLMVTNMRSALYGFTIAGTIRSSLDIKVTGLSVSNNTCFDGGAFHIFTNKSREVNVDISDANFEDNHGELAGAALCLDLYPDDKTQIVKLSNSRFTDNHNSESAAGIFLTGGTLIADQVNFTNNHVTTIASRLGSTPQRKGAGGAINFLKTTRLQLNRCMFVNNTANWFGGSLSGSGSVTITNSYFENSDRDVHSTIGDMIFLMGPAQVANITCNVKTTEENLPVFWYSSEYDLSALDDGYFNFTCPVGSQFRNESLPAVINGTVYAFKDLFYYCDPCPDGQYSLQNGFRHGSIEIGKGNWSSDFMCHKCSFGGVCKKGTIKSRINFWGSPESDGSTVSLMACPDGYCCDEAVCPSYDTCAPGRVGTLCGECQEGTSEILFSTECRPDAECKDSWYMLIDVLLAVVGLLFFLYQIEIATWILKYLFWQDVTPSDDPSMAGYIKTIFYFYQMVDLLTVQPNQAEAKIGVAIQPFISYLLTFRPLAAVFGVCPFPGLNPVTKNLLSTTQTLYMFAMVGILLGVYCIWKKYRRPRNGQQAYCCVAQDEQIEQMEQSSQHTHSTGFKARLATTCVSMFQYNYITIANACFILISCVPIGNASVLYFDGNVECLQPWQYFIILVNAIHVVPFFLVVIVSRQLLEKDRISLTAFFASYFLPLPFLLYWLIVWLQCKYKAERDNVDMGIEDSSLIHDRGAENQEIKDQILFVVEEPFVKHDDLENSARYWEGVLIFRRLALALLAAFVVETLLAVTLQTMLCLAFLLWHVYIKPYGSNSANNFETISLTTLTVIAICHLIQATLFSAGKLAEGPTQTQIYVTDWIEYILINLFPAILVILLLVAILVRLGYVMYLFVQWLIKKCR